MKEIEKVKKERDAWKSKAQIFKEEVILLKSELGIAKVRKQKKSYSPETAAAKIKIMVKGYYETLGRDGGDNNPFQDSSDLLGEIDNILHKTKISKKLLIVEDLEYDRKIRSHENL